MANILGSLFVELRAETAAFVEGMSKASYSAKQASRDIKGAFDSIGGAFEKALAPFGEVGAVIGETLSKIGDFAGDAAKEFPGLAGAIGTVAAPLAGMAAAAIAAGAAVATIAIEGADAIERLDNMSQKTGIAISDLLTFEAAGAVVDVSLEQMVSSMRKFDQAITGTSKQAAIAKVALHDLGVTSADPKEAILEVADAFSKMEDGPIKASMALAIFGKAGLDMIPVMNQGREGFERAAEAAAKFGPAITGGSLAATVKWKEATRDLSLSWQSFTDGLVGNVVPGISSLVEVLAKAVKNSSDLVDRAPELADILFPLGSFVFGGGGTKSKPGPPATFSQDQGFFPKAASDAIQKQQEESYDREAAHGAAAYSLELKKLEVQGAVLARRFQEAEALERQIPALERAVELEKQAAKAAEARAEFQRNLEKILREGQAGIGNIRPSVFTTNRGDPGGTRETAALAATDIPSPMPSDADLAAVSQSMKNVFSGTLTEGTQVGADALKAFYSSWSEQNKKATEEIDESYQKQMTEFQGLLALGEISQQQFSDVSVALEQERVRKIVKARDEEIRTWDTEAMRMGTFSQQAHAMLNEIVLDGQSLGGKIFESFHKGIDDLSTDLAKFVVTGQANFKQLAQGVEESIAKAGFQDLFAKATKSIGGAFGINLGGAGQLGTVGNPMYVIPAAGAGSLFGVGKGSQGAGIGGGDPWGFSQGGKSADDGSGDNGSGDGSSGLGNAFSSIFSSMTSVFSKLASSISGIFKGIMGIFSGGLAGGGDVTPGRAYLVGERHPEFFVPNQAGHVSPTAQLGSKQTVVNFHVHGVSDFDSFRKSQGQIMGDLHRSLAVAHGRNY